MPVGISIKLITRKNIRLHDTQIFSINMKCLY